MAATFLANPYTGVVESDRANLIGTVTACDHDGLVPAFLSKHANTSNQRVMPTDEPLRTISAQVECGHFNTVLAQWRVPLASQRLI